jgi:hypothetical protein
MRKLGIVLILGVLLAGCNHQEQALRQALADLGRCKADLADAQKEQASPTVLWMFEAKERSSTPGMWYGQWSPGQTYSSLSVCQTVESGVKTEGKPGGTIRTICLPAPMRPDK